MEDDGESRRRGSVTDQADSGLRRVDRPRRRRPRPRQADVADLAGVSSAVVSVVVNGRGDGGIRVGPETRERVWSAVRQLGYVPNPVARSLAGGRNQLLGVFTYEPVFPMDERNFYHSFLVGIEHAAESFDYDLMLFTRTGGDGRRQIYRDGVNALQLADGAILIGTHEDRDELSRLARDGFPFVFVGRREVPGAQVSYAAGGYAEATADIVGSILDHGHRRVAYLAGPGHHESGRDRHRGYREAHGHRNVPPDPDLTVSVPADRVDTEFVRSLLDRAVTAVVTTSAALCARLLAVLSAIDLTVPDDLSVACLGNSMDEVRVPAGVTAFEVPRHEMGRQSVRLLHSLLTDPDTTQPRRCVVPCPIVPGTTIAAPKIG